MTSTRNIDLVRSLGADHVVDYTTTDFARAGQRYARILDTVGNRSVADLRPPAAPGASFSPMSGRWRNRAIAREKALGPEEGEGAVRPW